jgi:hypothetical protein
MAQGSKIERISKLITYNYVGLEFPGPILFVLLISLDHCVLFFPSATPKYPDRLSVQGICLSNSNSSSLQNVGLI